MNCVPALREQVIGPHNEMRFEGPATGQMILGWGDYQGKIGEDDYGAERFDPPSVLILVKRDDAELEVLAADAVRELTSEGVRVLLDPELAAKMKYYHGVDDDGDYIGLFDPKSD